MLREHPVDVELTRYAVVDGLFASAQDDQVPIGLPVPPKGISDCRIIDLGISVSI